MNDIPVLMDCRNVNKELAIVEYPGNVQNVDNMLRTMGGITTISQVFSGEIKRLEIRYQPDNEFCKALAGDAQNNSGLLLKIKIRRSKRNPDERPLYIVEVLGHCKKTYTFDCLADYTYLPIVKDEKTGEARCARDDLIPRNVIDIDYFSRHDVKPLCVPYQFARADTVHTNLHRIDPKDDGQSDILGVLQKPYYDGREIVSFSLTDPFPMHPDPAVAKRMKVKYVSDEQLAIVKKLFDEKPCWTRFGLLYESGLSLDKLKHITPSVAYLFSNGPWRTMYTRYGYDPRKDFNSRYYQTFDLRLRYRTGMAEFVPNAHKFGSRNQDWERRPNEADIPVQGPQYPYLEEGKLPRARQWILRYCDLRINKVKEMLDKIPTPLAGATCNEKTGWLPPGFDVQIRQIINNSFKETMREYYKNRKEQEASMEDDEYISDDNEPDKDSDEYEDEITEEDQEDIDLDMDGGEVEVGPYKMEHMQIDDEEEL
ncbi:general transcription factor 3C polypeptide 5 [Episyrphus balteatus]|uniref:general transcription factor 3C polypeptide 5 n=1 Tax=Episyrphus balteatus TaxID=286459 RepID=UPI002485E862|nr:general transcription factor 3C polypeptide 5 [Episyrphus balteatus]